jgi:uncharacterized membrane protein YeaQ/YmgE (transglycosylase-associated protein family)
MRLISWPIKGIIAGVLAKLVMPGEDPGGILATIFYRHAWRFFGGLIVGVFGGTGVTGINIWSILVAALGALELLALFRLVTGRGITQGLLILDNFLTQDGTSALPFA